MDVAGQGERLIVLAVDGGSSSLKLTAYEMSDERRVAQANIPIDGIEADLGAFIDSLEANGTCVSAIVHRVVFGGADHVEPEVLTDALLEAMEALVPFDTLHLRAELDAIRLTKARLPSVPQVLCFDTAFHARMPSIAKRYPLGKAFGAIQRYGYHGLSLEYIVSIIGKSGRAIVAHLGSGASVSAIRDGEPIDTSMGFSPLGGIMMATRPGDLDPGVLLYAAIELGFSAELLREMITRQSGLLGVSETTGDMRELIARAPADERARNAVDLFVYIARKHIGALATTLGGVDLLVFTGGIGENSADIRTAIADGLAFLRPFDVRVIPTNEALVMCRHAARLIHTSRT